MPYADKQRDGVNRYPVISVEKIDTPKGAKGTWYRYVIGQGNTQLTGSRQGTLNQVTAYANEYAQMLNERSGGKGSSVWSKRIKKTTE